MKKCSRCGEMKSLFEFSNNKSRKDGKTPYCKKCLSIIYKRREATLSRIFYRYKKSAKDRGFVFEFSKEDFSAFLNGQCVYCRDTINGVGLDRKDNKEGYTKENCVNCCSTCNYMKGKLPESVFTSQCKKISNFL